MKVLLIDYDGVIVNSDPKSLFIGYNAYNRINKYFDKYLFGEKYLTFMNFREIIRNNDEKIRLYKKLRAYVKDASDFLLIMDLIRKGITIRNQKDFDSKKIDLGFNKEKYIHEFYKEKERIHKIDFLESSKLEPAYQDILEGLLRFSNEGIHIFIATLNRKKDVLKYFNINYPILKNCLQDILDISFGESKRNQIKYITNKYSVEYKDIYFIDDQISHLIQTKDFGINLFLAGWSYATNEQKKEAIQRGITVINSERMFYDCIKSSIDDNKISKKS